MRNLPRIKLLAPSEGKEDKRAEQEKEEKEEAAVTYDGQLGAQELTGQHAERRRHLFFAATKGCLPPPQNTSGKWHFGHGLSVSGKEGGSQQSEEQTVHSQLPLASDLRAEGSTAHLSARPALLRILTLLIK